VGVPGWARNEAVPNDLYRFVDQATNPVVLKVNRRVLSPKLDRGYVILDREWKRNDSIEIVFPMPVRRLVAHPQVDADRGRVALQRGPIVYCVEGPDNPQGHARNLVVSDDTPLTTRFEPGLLKGIQVIRGKAVSLAYDDQDRVVRREQGFTAIPYYAWANRGAGEMTVWIPNNESVVKPRPKPTTASTSAVQTSGGQNPRAINDQAEPESSSDGSNAYFHWWPIKGTTEWVEYTFTKPARVSEVEVYWFDDTGRGEVRVPQSWHLLYNNGNAWAPVETSDAYGVAKDRYNKVAFKPVTTTGLRLEVTMQRNWSAGIQEWKVK